MNRPTQRRPSLPSQSLGSPLWRRHKATPSPHPPTSPLLFVPKKYHMDAARATSYCGVGTRHTYKREKCTPGRKRWVGWVKGGILRKGHCCCVSLVVGLSVLLLLFFFFFLPVFLLLLLLLLLLFFTHMDPTVPAVLTVGGWVGDPPPPKDASILTSLFPPPCLLLLLRR